MKIALIGDYSGVHLGLKKGFETLGHEAHIYSDGDGYKKISSDKKLFTPNDRYVDKLLYFAIELPELLKKISSQYDAIQLMNPFVMPRILNSPAYYAYLMSILKNTQGYKSLAVVGCDKNTQRVVPSMFRSPCIGCIKDSGLPKCQFIYPKYSRITDHAVDFADVVIPMGGPTYHAAYSHLKKTADLLPFPVDTTLVPYTGNRLGKKIRILHGLHGINRAFYKGSDVIMSALERAQSVFPESFEIVNTERLPFNEYIKLMATVNVVIDQLFGDALGMNALFSMAAGCVVVTSFERAAVGGVDLFDAPAIQIGNSADEIFEQLAKMRAWSAHDFELIGEQSRKYVLSNCAPDEIASRVMEIWQNSSSTASNDSQGRLC
jgi:hypothetical protein